MERPQNGWANTVCEAVIQKALSFVGCEAIPRTSNRVIFNTDYHGREVSGDEYPWCVTFLWDVFRMAGCSQCFFGGEKTDECTDLLRWGTENGLLVDKIYVRRGDLAFYSWDGSPIPEHVGLVLERKEDGGFLAVEGNTSEVCDPDGGRVMIRPRKPEWTVAVLRPQYGCAEKEL